MADLRTCRRHHVGWWDSSVRSDSCQPCGCICVGATNLHPTAIQFEPYSTPVSCEGHRTVLPCRKQRPGLRICRTFLIRINLPHEAWRRLYSRTGELTVVYLVIYSSVFQVFNLCRCFKMAFALEVKHITNVGHLMLMRYVSYGIIML
jgi:hypothetical protein